MLFAQMILLHRNNIYCIIGCKTDNEASREDTLDIASTLDSGMNGSVANGTICTIPKPLEKANKFLNVERSLPFALSHATPFSDTPTNFSPRPNNLGFQRVSDECLVSNNHFPGNVDNNLEHAKSSISQSAAVPTAYDDKFAALQRKNYNFAPLHVECDPVGNFIDSVNFNNLIFILASFVHFFSM